MSGWPGNIDYHYQLGENHKDCSRLELLCRVGLWRSWERASMAWKRSSVRSRSGPPIIQQLSGPASSDLVAFGSKFSKPCCKGVVNLPALLLSCKVRRPDTVASPPPDFGLVRLLLLV